MKKRMISLLAAGILVVGSLAGCGNTTETEAPAAESSAPAAAESSAPAAEESSAAADAAVAEESSAAEVAEANTDLSGSVSMSGSRCV